MDPQVRVYLQPPPHAVHETPHHRRLYPQNSPPQNTFVDTVEGSPVDFSYGRVCPCDHSMDECVHMPPVDEYTVEECVSKTPPAEEGTHETTPWMVFI